MVEKLKTEYHAEVEWRPYYLRPDTPPEGMPLPDYIRRAASSHARLDQLARSYGMPMVRPEWIPNTRHAHEATEHARAHGQGEAFHRAVFRKYFGEGQDIGRWEVLRSAAEEVGLDADELQRDVEGGTYTSSVEAQVTQAYNLGVSGVPTYVLNERYAVVGARPYDVFQQVIARLIAEAGNEV